MRKFKAEAEDGISTYTYKNKTLRTEFAKGYFEELIDNDDIYTFRWRNAQGSGSLDIPATVFFALPAMATMLHWANGNNIFQKVKLYEDTPKTVLFGDKEDEE